MQKLLVEAFARTRRRYPPDVRQRHAAGDFADAEDELIAYFHESIAPIDVSGFAAEALEDPEETYCLLGAQEAPSTSVTRRVSFFMWAGLTEEGALVEGSG